MVTRVPDSKLQKINSKPVYSREEIVMFEEMKEKELTDIEGGAWNWKAIAAFWGGCYTVGYVIGETVGNLTK